MKVERIDLYDFKVVLDETIFQSVKRIADVYGVSLEQVLHRVIERGLHFELEDLFREG